MTEIIELDNRVLEITTTPDTPGYRRRRMTVQLLSGPGITEEESERVRQGILEVCAARGIKFISLTFGDEK